MKFGSVPLSEAEGAVLAHSVATPGGRLRKGRVLSAEDIAALREAKLDCVTVARLEPGDVDENTAAQRLADAVAGPGLRVAKPFTGRVNLMAEGPGIVLLDVAALEAVNAVDPMITIATVPNHQQMRDGGMVATIKMISYAVAGQNLDRACALAGQGHAIRLASPRRRRAVLIVTVIPKGPGDKGSAAIAARLEALDAELTQTLRVPHELPALTAALRDVEADVVLILTGSATSDPQDVAPAAVRAAGGEVHRFGMPVDPGNLLFIGELGAVPVIGLPGCARAPALNGADWVLSRVLCDVPVSSADIAAMGVGGLLKEIPSRPQPRRPRKD